MKSIWHCQNWPRNKSRYPKILQNGLSGLLNLKEIADICEIRKDLTFHLARHTFATTVTLSNGVPIETVSNLLGHRSIATTQIYARVLENKVSEDMTRLKDKFTGTKAVEQKDARTGVGKTGSFN